jgi:hypothetical protein
MRHVCPARNRLLPRPLRPATLGAAWLVCITLPACNQSGERTARPLPSAPVKSREEVIRGTADAILAECQSAAGGDWERWQRDTACYRTALKAKVDVLKRSTDPLPPIEERHDELEASSEVLEGKNNFPLFEVAPWAYLPYLYDSDYWNGRHTDQPVFAAHRWLRARGIDLIFVPVPKMTEVYIENFLDPCPADGIIAPNIRHTFLELLNEGVEVVDAYRLYRSLRNTDREYLYDVADSHWAPRAMRIMAKELADRIRRYDFGAKAQSAPPITISVLSRFDREQYGWPALKPYQKKLAEAAKPGTFMHPVRPNGQQPPDDPNSPVIVIGHSYVDFFRDEVIGELNLLTNTITGPGFTTQFFADFLREPEQLSHCKVIVWITTDGHMPSFEPLPPAITAALQGK